MDDRTYWARADVLTLEAKLNEKINRYYRAVESNGMLRTWRMARDYFFCGSDAGGSGQVISFGGEQGESVRLSLNHGASIVQGCHAIVTGAKPTTRAIAATAERKGADQASLADKLLDYEREQKGLDALLSRAALQMLTSAEAWVLQMWDDTAGAPQGVEVDPTTGQERLVYEGDVSTKMLHGLDVWRDIDVKLDAAEVATPWTWLGCRHLVNRWELAEKYPQYADEILGATTQSKHLVTEELVSLDSSTRETDSDQVYVYEWFHRPTLALPSGRHARLCGGTIIDDTLTLNRPYPYGRDLPLAECMPMVLSGTAFGYTPMWLLLGPQDAFDSILSAALSNLETFGEQRVWAEHPIDLKTLGKGLVQLVSQTKPESLQLTNVADAAWKMLDFLQRGMETLSGNNRTTRGDPEASLKSGAALALVASLAVQHNSVHHATFANLIKRVYTGRVKLWQQYVTIARIAEVAGDDERVSAQEWKGEDIAGVSRVAVEITNPILSTSQGKLELAREMANRINPDGTPWITRDEFLQVMRTGRFEPVFQHTISQVRLIKRENEALRSGKPAPVLWSDEHHKHIPEHMAELADPLKRMDVAAVEACKAHVMEHDRVWAETSMMNPSLLQAAGIPLHPITTGAMPPPPEEDGGAPVEGEEPPPEEGATPAPRAVVPGAQDNPIVPGGDMPIMPAIPGTGVRPTPGSEVM
jgi:hypothetical protein